MRLRCILGAHRYELLYADTGNPKNQYRPDVLCIFCRRPAPLREWRRAAEREERRLATREGTVR